MEIQSAFASGMQGLQRASTGITEATVNINRDAVNQQRVRNAQDSAADAEANNVRNQAARQSANPDANQVPNTTQSLVQLSMEAVNAAANVRAIRSADEMLGTLIDVTV